MKLNQRSRQWLPLGMLLLGVIACGVFDNELFEEDGEIASSEPGLEIINTTDTDLCFITVSASTESDWGPNILRGTLSPGEAFLYDGYVPGENDFLAQDCGDEIVDEQYQIELGTQFIIWRIGESIEPGTGPTAAQPSAPSIVEVETVERPPVTVAGPALEVINTTPADICNIQVGASVDEFFGNNLLGTTLASGESFTVTDFPNVDYYTISITDCNSTVVDEREYIFLGQDEVTLPIGEPVEFGGGPAEPLQIDYEPVYEQDSCPFNTAGQAIDCGYLIVPENRSNPDTAYIELAIAILRNTRGVTLDDPIVHLSGGPGQSMIDLLAADPEAYTIEPFAANRDQIFIDQRGTGYSFPTLNCPEVEEVDFDFAASANPGLDASTVCRDRLVSEGVDVTAYNTAENAADINDLRIALGYEQVNLFGISYGTRLALAVMRDHPEAVRTATLDSVFPPDLNVIIEDSVSLYTAIQTAFAACQEDPDCNAAYPGLESVFLDLVTDLNSDPAVIDYEDPETGDFIEYELYGDDVVNEVTNALYSASLTMQYIPRAIYDAYQGDYETMSALVTLNTSNGFSAHRQSPGEDVSDSEGMFTTVTCHDEYAFEDYVAAEEVVLEQIPEELHTALFYGIVGNQYLECVEWGAGKALAYENDPVVSNVPTLLIVGHFDPVTPPSQARQAAETLNNAYYVEFPTMGHSVTAFSFCPTGIMADFIDNPFEQPNTSCVEREPAIVFLLPGEPIPDPLSLE